MKHDALEGNAHLWLYTKSMYSVPPKSKLERKRLPVPPARPFTHWGILVEYCQPRSGEGTGILYDACPDGEYLIGRERDFDWVKRSWTSNEGFAKKDLGIHKITEEDATAFVRNFNRRNLKYA